MKPYDRTTFSVRHHFHITPQSGWLMETHGDPESPLFGAINRHPMAPLGWFGHYRFLPPNATSATLTPSHPIHHGTHGMWCQCRAGARMCVLQFFRYQWKDSQQLGCVASAWCLVELPGRPIATSTRGRSWCRGGRPASGPIRDDETVHKELCVPMEPHTEPQKAIGPSWRL